jgi:hypothetical protein
MLAALLLSALPGLQGPESEVLRFVMDTRGVPGSWVPGLENQREDSRKPPRITKEQLTRVQGLEVDMLRAIAGQMGARPEIVPCSWFDLESCMYVRWRCAARPPPARRQRAPEPPRIPRGRAAGRTARCSIV